MQKNVKKRRWGKDEAKSSDVCASALGNFDTIITYIKEFCNSGKEFYKRLNH